MYNFFFEQNHTFRITVRAWVDPWSVLWECYMVVAANRGNHHFSNFAEIF